MKMEDKFYPIMWGCFELYNLLSFTQKTILFIVTEDIPSNPA
jgi:hypothetical protein